MTRHPRTHQFRKHQDVAVVEYDPMTVTPVDGAEPAGACVVETRKWSVTVRDETGHVELFLVDFLGRPWREAGRLRLVPVCCSSDCGRPVLGLPVTMDGDPGRTVWCGPDCYEESAEAYAGQRVRGAW